MNADAAIAACPLCRRFEPLSVLHEAAWLPTEIVAHMAAGHRGWTVDKGACHVCVQQNLREWWVERSNEAGSLGLVPYRNDGRLIPFGVLPLDMVLGTDPRFAGRGVTIAMVDSGFYPHPDITGLPDDDEWPMETRNRIRAWADTSTSQVRQRFFAPNSPPRWPGWHRRHASQWHGMMTTAAAAGTGACSHGLYRGFASHADLVLIQTWDGNGRITNASIARALKWLIHHRERLNLRVVNLSVGGDPLKRLTGNFVDTAVAELVEAGVVVVAASGNSGKRRLLPPASAPHSITVGGVDTRNSPESSAWTMWHSNWGKSWAGGVKPEILAPGIWIAAPILPGSHVASDAAKLFEKRTHDDHSIESRIAGQKLLTPHFQHVDGTSFSCALASGVVACMLEANPSLSPEQVRRILMDSAVSLPNVPENRQGAGVMQPAAAIWYALEAG